MKLTSLLALPLGLSLGSAIAEAESIYSGLYLAHGLCEENGVISGWHDAEKTREDDIDDLMCYAASASNLLAWWQNSSYSVASEAPTELNDIWSTFVNNNQIQNSGGTFQNAVNWWVSGVYSPSVYNDADGAWDLASESDPVWARHHLKYSAFVTEDGQAPAYPMTLPNYQKDGAAFGGYYYDQYGLTKQDLTDFLPTIWSYFASETSDAPDTETDGTIALSEFESKPSICGVDFVETLESSAISLAIFSDEGNLGHAITLWGVEYDENGNLTTLWLTDSDDYINQIFSATVTLDEDANKIYIGELVGEGEDAYYFSEAYDYYKNVYIGEIYALNTEDALKWQLVPEPTTVTLSLLALCGIAARRRRIP